MKKKNFFSVVRESMNKAEENFEILRQSKLPTTDGKCEMTLISNDASRRFFEDERHEKIWWAVDRIKLIAC